MLQGPLNRPRLATGSHVALRHPAHHLSGWELLLVGGQPRESGKTLPPPPPPQLHGPNFLTIWERQQEDCGAEQGELRAGRIPRLHHPSTPRPCTFDQGVLMKSATRVTQLPDAHPARERTLKANEEDKQKAGKKTSFLDLPSPGIWGEGPAGHPREQKKIAKFNPWKPSTVGRERECFWLQSASLESCPPTQVSPVLPTSTVTGGPREGAWLHRCPPPAQLPPTCPRPPALSERACAWFWPNSQGPAALPSPCPQPQGTLGPLFYLHTWARQSQPPSLAAPPQPSRGRLAGRGPRRCKGRGTSLLSLPIWA